MRFFTLLFVAVLSTTVPTGCERQFLSPVSSIDPPQINTQSARMALSALAETAAQRAFLDLAHAANGVAEVLAIEDGTSVEPTFSRIAKLAQEVTVLEQAFARAGCGIKFWIFAEASVDAVRAYTIRNAAAMERALQNLAHGAVAAETALQQLPAENTFIPFAFGYHRTSDVYGYGELHHGWNKPAYPLGEFLVRYDNTIRPWDETQTAVIEFLTNKGFKVTTQGGLDYWSAVVFLGTDIDPRFVMGEVRRIAGVADVHQESRAYPTMAPPPPPSNVQIIDRVRTRYNEAWCQGNFDAMDSILTGEVGLDFFDYSFVRNLADIYAEEIPGAAERIRTNGFSLRSIAIEFLNIYFEHSTPPPQSPASGETFYNLQRKLDEIDLLIEHFRQSVRYGNVSIAHATVPNYYYWIWNN